MTSRFPLSAGYVAGPLFQQTYYVPTVVQSGNTFTNPMAHYMLLGPNLMLVQGQFTATSTVSAVSVYITLPSNKFWVIPTAGTLGMQGTVAEFSVTGTSSNHPLWVDNGNQNRIAAFNMTLTATRTYGFMAWVQTQ